MKALFKLPVVGKVTWVHLLLAVGAWWMWRQSSATPAALPPGSVTAGSSVTADV